MAFVLNNDGENRPRNFRSEAVVALQCLNKLVSNSNIEDSQLRDIINELEYLRAQINSSIGSSAIHGRKYLSRETDENRILIASISNAIDRGKKMLNNLSQHSEIKFNGSPVEWFRFLETFEKSVHSRSDYSDVCKLRCLLNMVEGLPFETIKRLPLIDASYVKALEMLKDTFKNEKVLIEAHLHELFDLKPPEAVPESLSKFRCDYEYHIRALKKYEAKFEKSSGFVIAELLKKKLPKEIQDRISKANLDNYWCLSNFIRALNYEIDFLSSYQHVNDNSMKSDSNEQNNISTEDLRMFLKRNRKNMQVEKKKTKKEIKRKQKKEIKEKKILKKLKAKSTPNNKPKKTLFPCVFCKCGHLHPWCSTYGTGEERRKRARQLKLCGHCLSKLHSSRECKCNLKCIFCGGRHTTSLCLRRKRENKLKKLMELELEEEAYES